jgi:hypothetical protein
MRRFASLLLVAACAGDEPVASGEAEPIPPPPKDAIAKAVEHGPVKATVRVWPAKPTLGDPIYLRLEIEAPAGIDVQAPFHEVGAGVGRFEVKGFARANEPTKTGALLHTQTFTLDAPSSGRSRIPPLRFEVVDNRTAGAKPGQIQEVLTDEISLEVAPVPAEVAWKPLEPATGPLEDEVGGTSWLVVVGIASAAVIAISAGLLVALAMGRRRRLERQRSAYEEAVAHLVALEQRGAPDAATADAWFVELSAIVRRYLELRYEIRAPELTTEEFLLVATGRGELLEEHRALLSQFLERCDRVKFAGYRPDADESLASLKAARGFVEDTRLRDEVQTSSAGRAA